MASVNKVILIGNCGRDPEVRYLPSGSAVANVSIATTSRRKDKTSGEMVEDTQWHRLVFFERQAELAGEYLKKGSPVYVEGRLRYGKYTTKEGVERDTTDIVVYEMQFLGGRGTGAATGATEHSAAERPARAANAATPAAPAANAAAPAAGAAAPFADMDDDIPF